LKKTIMELGEEKGANLSRKAFQVRAHTSKLKPVIVRKCDVRRIGVIQQLPLDITVEERTLKFNHKRL
jgi:hypothetical protein